MPVNLQNRDFPEPSGQVHHPGMMDYVKCYHCDRLLRVADLAAFPFGYLRSSYNIIPTWMADGTIKGRAAISPMIPRHIRGTPMAVPFICKTCWAFCQQTDKIVQDLGFGHESFDDRYSV